MADGYRYGDETPITAGFNAVLEKLGERGRDGFSPVVEVNEIEGGHEVIVVDAIHTERFGVMDGSPGQNYVITAQDKAEIAALVEADYSNGDATGY